MTIKILIVDDQQMIAEGIAALLATAPDLEVVCVLLGGSGIGVQAALYKP